MMRVESVVTRSRSVWSEIPTSLRARSSNARTNAPHLRLGELSQHFRYGFQRTRQHVDYRALLHTLDERIESGAERPEELSHSAVREPDLLLETMHEVMERFRRHADEDVGRGLGADGIARECLDEVGDDLGNVDLSREQDRDRLRLDENGAERHR